MAIFQQHYFTR